MAPHLRLGGARHRTRRRLPLGPPAPLLRIQLQRQLAQLEVFAGCDRRQLGRLARWGDLVQVDAGEVLLREDHADWWFVVVLSGTLGLTRSGRPVGSAGPGDHLGADTIVGLRPQRATVRTATPAVLFMLGPRYLLSLLTASPTFQRTLFPDVGPAEYPEFSHRMLEEGRADWQRVGLPPGWSPAGAAPPKGPSTKGPPTAAWPVRAPRPGRTLSLREAVALITKTAPDDLDLITAVVPARRNPWWARTAVAGAAAVILSTLFAYHPPLAVVTVGRPIDVVGDITVSGAPTHQPDGHFLLLWIRVSRPSLVGTLRALLTGQTTVSTGPDPGPGPEAAAERAARHQYLDSRVSATTAALHLAEVDPRRVHVHIRDRGLTGPSAGLVYALAITDLLGNDLTHGRTVAATGTIGPDGAVGAVGWVTVKSEGASAAGATILLVPAGEQPGTAGYRGSVLPVTSLSQAVALLTRGHS